MEECIWGEKPEALPVGWAETLYYPKPDLDAFHVKLQASFDESMADCHHSLELITRKLAESREKADKWDEHLKEPERCGYLKPGYGCDSPVGIGNSVMCRRLPNCEILEEESVFKTLEDAKTWLIKAKAEGRISMNAGFSLGLVLGVEDDE